MSDAAETKPAAPAHVPRTQAERSETTIGAIVTAARELFATNGYAGTSIEDIVRAAGVTRGAMYHHFSGKSDVFRAVLSNLTLELDQKAIGAYQGDGEPWGMVEAAADVILEFCSDPHVHRIMFDDAGSVLAADELRDLRGERVHPFLAGVLEHEMRAGTMRRRPIEAMSALMYGGIREAAAMVTRADDRETALAECKLEVRTFLNAIRTS